jgi:rare lipoprotein A
VNSKLDAAGLPARNSTSRMARGLTLLCVSALLASCVSDPVKVTYVKKKPAQAKEYFAEKEYGVKASPRVIAAAANIPGVKMRRMPRGGGREQVGKPYQIRGKWYYPREEQGYDRSGIASWYGDAFHGRKTANGEIYDMQQLSAAHPTMPLPSYAKVTNLKNGNSIIVRVNDRGPYAHGRIIDMSKRAAQMLDYTGTGVAQVRVQYVGRAPLHGRDDAYLLASFAPGNGAPLGDAVPPNVMVASAEPAADLPGVNSATAFEGEEVIQSAAPADPFEAMQAGDVPAVGPLVPDKPVIEAIEPTPVAMNGKAEWVAAYASERVDAAYGAAAPFKAMGLTEEKIRQSWKKQASAAPSNGEFVLVGTFSTSEAKRLSGLLAPVGKTAIETSGTKATLTLTQNGGASADALLEASWQAGASDAFIVRD